MKKRANLVNDYKGSSFYVRAERKSIHLGAERNEERTIFRSAPINYRNITYPNHISRTFKETKNVDEVEVETCLRKLDSPTVAIKFNCFVKNSFH